jgi:hypothetical protein
VVYFIQGDHSQLIKIGKTVDLVSRLGSLQGASPDKLTVLAVIANENGDYEYHEIFADAWSHGEWFHPSPDLLAFIGRIPESQYSGLCIRLKNNRTVKAVISGNQGNETHSAWRSRQHSLELLRLEKQAKLSGTIYITSERSYRGENQMDLKIKAKTITCDSDGVRHFTFEPDELTEILQKNFDADVAIVDGNGEEIRVFNTKDYLAATAFLHLQKSDTFRQ